MASGSNNKGDKAKSQGFKSRAIYKLKEIDEKHHLITPSSRVVDLGCAPGSWSQYVSQQLGPKGRVLGLDLHPVHLNLPNATFLRTNAFEWEPPDEYREKTHLVLSDMAPDLSGIWANDSEKSVELCLRVLTLSCDLLHPTRGKVLLKVFHGSMFPEFLKLFRSTFADSKLIKPDGSRNASAEVYLLGKKFKRPKDPLFSEFRDRLQI